jgi:hypothetical protein
MSGRTLAPLGAVPTGAGIALLTLGFTLEDSRRTGGYESLSVYGGAATLAGGVLAIVGFLWASMTACQGYVINYGQAGDVLYQRCSGSMTPVPFAAIIVALIGGVLLPLVLLPGDSARQEITADSPR